MNHDFRFAVCIAMVALLLGLHTLALHRHNNRLDELQNGFDGTHSLHDRITQTQVEQLRLERQLEELRRPAGAKTGAK